MSGYNETFFKKYFTDLARWLLFLLKLQTRSRVKKKSQKRKQPSEKKLTRSDLT